MSISPVGGLAAAASAINAFAMQQSAAAGQAPGRQAAAQASELNASAPSSGGASLQADEGFQAGSGGSALIDVFA
jgi:hypothetical protein